MDVQIVERGETKLVGMVFYGDPFKEVQGWSDENQIGRLWTRFSAYWEAHPELFEHVIEPSVGYEVHIGTEEYEETREYFIFVGAEVSSFESVPPVTFGKVLEAGTYALFTLKGKEIASNWGDAIYKEWLPASEYKEGLPYTVERYDARFTGPEDPESVLEIWVPVKPKADEA